MNESWIQYQLQNNPELTYDDSNENNIDKSWYKGTDIHQKFNDYIYSYGMKLLDKTPYADRRETKVSILKRTLVKYIFE